MSRCFVNHANGLGQHVYHARGPYTLNATLLLSLSKDRKFDLLYNHGPRYTWMSKVMSSTPRFYTIVRDPMERAVSVLAHGRTPSFAKTHHGTFCSGFSDVDDAIDSCAEIRNYQSWYVTPKEDGTNRLICTDALCVLRSFALVMPLHRIDDCRTLLVLDHGFTLAEALCATRNQHHEDQPIAVNLTTSQLARLREGNARDIALYDAAVDAIDARVAALGSSFTETSTALRTLYNDTIQTCTIPQTTSSESGIDKRLAKFRKNFECLRQRTAVLMKSLNPPLPAEAIVEREPPRIAS